MDRAYLPLDSPISAYEWNACGVCVNPALFFSHHVGPSDHVEIMVAARPDSTTGEARWFAASDYEYKDGGGGALPSSSRAYQPAPRRKSIQEAGFDEIESLLRHHEKCWYPLFSPTAEKKLREKLAQRIVGVQASLF